MKYKITAIRLVQVQQQEVTYEATIEGKTVRKVIVMDLTYPVSVGDHMSIGFSPFEQRWST